MDADAEVRHDQVIGDLRRSYDRSAADRDRIVKTAWKQAERQAFADRLRERGLQRLLELGAGTGQDAAYFQELGLTVTATDPSPEMVRRCREKGLDAQVMDMADLTWPAGSFDAVYAMNCLLHIPNADLPDVLEGIRSVLRPGGLFFLGVYGGDGTEGVWEGDPQRPPRFFSFRTNEQIQAQAGASFEIVDFHALETGDGSFQSLTLH